MGCTRCRFFILEIVFRPLKQATGKKKTVFFFALYNGFRIEIVSNSEHTKQKRVDYGF